MINNIKELIVFLTTIIVLVGGIISIFTFVKRIKKRRNRILIYSLISLFVFSGVIIYICSRLSYKNENEVSQYSNDYIYEKSESEYSLLDNEDINEITISENKLKTITDNEINVEFEDSIINPRIIGQCDISIPSYKICMEGEYIYVLSWGFDIIDVSNKENPVLKNSFSTNYRSYGSYVYNGYVYLADFDNGGFEIIEISNNKEPEVIGKYYGFIGAFNLFVLGDYVYMCDSGKLQIIDVSKKNSPQAVLELKDFNMISDIFVNNEYMYVLDEGIMIFENIGNRIKNVRKYEIPNFSSLKFCINDNFIYVIGNYMNYPNYSPNYNGRLYLIDFTDIDNPNITGIYEIDGYPKDVFVNDDYVFLVNGNNDLEILNAKNKSNPYLVTSIDLHEEIRNVYSKDNFAYIATIFINEYGENKEYNYYLKVIQLY